MITAKQVQDMLLFNEKVGKLENGKFFQYILRQRPKITIKKNANQPAEIDVLIPDEDATDAFILTVRFFIQDNESTSLSNMAKLYESMDISDEQKENIRQARNNLNEYLDSESMITWRKQRLSRRDIFDTFIYGGLAHANEIKKKIYDEWTVDKVTSHGFEFEFTNILLTFLSPLKYIKKLNLQILEEA